MSQNDTLQRFLFENRSVRGEIVHLSESFKAIVSGRDYPEKINELLGQALASAAIICGLLKGKGRLTVQFQGSTTLRLLTASCTHEYHLRGLAQFDEGLDETTLLDAFNTGKLAVTFQPEKGAPYQGIVDISHGQIGKAIESYFEQSEQLPSKLFIAVDKHRVSALFLQALPDASGTMDDWQHAITLAQTITDKELLSLENKTLLHRLFNEDDLRVFDKTPVSFRCTCSQFRSENAIKLMGEPEANQLLKEKQVIDVTCDFCNTHYSFDRVDVKRIFSTDINPPSSTSSH